MAKLRVTKEHTQERKRRNYLANKEKMITQTKESYKRNREKRMEYSKEWAQRNKARQTHLNTLTKARGLNLLMPNMTEEHLEAIFTLYKQSERKSAIEGIKYNVDHILPLSKGGLHIQSNLQVITAKANILKGNTTL